MPAVGIKAPILGQERWFCFNLRAQIEISKKYGSLLAAIDRFNDAFFADDSGAAEEEKAVIVADWCEALTVGGRAYARHTHGEDSEPVTAEDILDLCSPHELGETAAAILAAINSGGERDVSDPPSDGDQKKTI